MRNFILLIKLYSLRKQTNGRTFSFENQFDCMDTKTKDFSVDDLNEDRRIIGPCLDESKLCVQSSLSSKTNVLWGDNREVFAVSRDACGWNVIQFPSTTVVIEFRFEFHSEYISRVARKVYAFISVEMLHNVFFGRQKNTDHWTVLA